MASNDLETATHPLLAGSPPGVTSAGGLGSTSAASDPLKRASPARSPPNSGVKSPVVAAAASDASGSGGAKPASSMSSQDWLLIGVAIWIGIALMSFILSLLIESVVITIEIIFDLIYILYVPIGIANLLKFHQDIDRNQYRRLTNLPIWKIVDNNSISYGVLGLCGSISILEMFTGGWSAGNAKRNFPLFLFAYTFSILKGATLALFVSRKSYTGLVRWKIMRDGSQKNMELVKTLFTVVPAAIDWLHFDTWHRRYSYHQFMWLSGCFLHFFLLFSFLVAAIDFVRWSRTPAAKVELVQRKQQVYSIYSNIRKSSALKNLQQRAVATTRSVATAVANAMDNNNANNSQTPASPPRSGGGISTASTPGSASAVV
mmetsp:Transcript_6358/g.18684  ORF Transcript_6358/g.18684 Transcript_6358/m.18684 type:complete len:374 (-) Transcript_6358:137-1258(-)